MIGRRRVIVPITEELFAEVLKAENRLPATAKVVARNYNANIGRWEVVVEDESFEDIHRGAPFPIWEPPTTTHKSFVNEIIGDVWHLHKSAPEEPPPKKKWREFL